MKYLYLSDSVRIKKILEKDVTGEFHIEGLYTGYGVTMGSALRRALLSSLPGAAISQVKIKDVKHEFSTIPGMVEDIVEFTLNLKQVRFRFYADEPQVLKLSIKGKKDVTAGDIEPSTLVEVVNPNLVIATLSSSKSELDAEITVEKGLGYVPAEARQAERLAIGTIMLDCIFSPVVNIEFHVENMRVGERTDYNRLKIKIETDGSITPSRALHQAANILRDHFEKVSAIGADEQAAIEDKAEAAKEKEAKTKKGGSKKKSVKKSSGKYVCEVCGFEAKSERGLKAHKTQQGHK